MGRGLTCSEKETAVAGVRSVLVRKERSGDGGTVVGSKTLEYTK
jgi:hypothetical protein